MSAPNVIAVRPVSTTSPSNVASRWPCSSVLFSSRALMKPSGGCTRSSRKASMSTTRKSTRRRTNFQLPGTS